MDFVFVALPYGVVFYAHRRFHRHYAVAAHRNSRCILIRDMRINQSFSNNASYSAIRLTSQ